MWRVTLTYALISSSHQLEHTAEKAYASVFDVTEANIGSCQAHAFDGE